ncbi:MAG: hypothetical protein V1672_03280 [Candidatus Diapherotrites archaeon]
MHEIRREKQPLNLHKKPGRISAYLWEEHIKQERIYLKTREAAFKKMFFTRVNEARKVLVDSKADSMFKEQVALKHLKEAKATLDEIYTKRNFNDHLNTWASPHDPRVKEALTKEIDALRNQLFFIDRFAKPGEKIAKSAMTAFAHDGKRMEAQSLMFRAIKEVEKQLTRLEEEHELMPEKQRELNKEQMQDEHAYLEAVLDEYESLLEQIQLSMTQDEEGIAQ